MDTNRWPQGIGLVKPIESPTKPVGVERKPRPQKEHALNCPRCNSTNTKFCYYNNYSLSQPRYFCKTCRRYWTEGGTLRNVPVGGGSRKNKRSSISTTSSSSHPQAAAVAAVNKIPDLSHLSTSLGFSSQRTSQNPKIHEGQDLNLAYPRTANYTSGNTSVSGLVHLPYASPNNDNKSLDDDSNPSNIMSSSALELLKSASTNGISPKALSPLMSMPNFSVTNTTFYSSVLPMQDFKPKLNFSQAGFDHGGFESSLHGISNNVNGTARLFLPYEDLKPLSMNSITEKYHQQENRVREGGQSTGSYWNGMLGGGTW